MQNIFSGNVQQVIIDFLTAQMVWWYFVVMLGLVIIISIIVLWHWSKYSAGLLRKVGVQITYLIITGILAIIFFVSITRLIAIL